MSLWALQLLKDTNAHSHTQIDFVFVSTAVSLTNQCCCCCWLSSPSVYPQRSHPSPFLLSLVDNPVSVHSPSLVNRSLSTLIVSNKNSHTYALSLSLCRTHTGDSFISMKTDNKSLSYHTNTLSRSFFLCSFFHISFRLSGGRLDAENMPLFCTSLTFFLSLSFISLNQWLSSVGLWRS